MIAMSVCVLAYPYCPPCWNSFTVPSGRLKRTLPVELTHVSSLIGPYGSGDRYRLFPEDAIEDGAPSTPTRETRNRSVLSSLILAGV